MWRSLTLTVMHHLDPEHLEVIVYEGTSDGEMNSWSVPCDSASLPSVLCELAHERTGSFILASDGA